ncbi:MAG: helix-turn-helix domain-containing protein [Planctomycetota bacterium]
MDTGEQWVDIDDVSAHLKVNKETVRRWIKERDFPSHRAGHLLRFKLSEVDEWVRQGGGKEFPNDEATGQPEKDRR